MTEMTTPHSSSTTDMDITMYLNTLCNIATETPDMTSIMPPPPIDTPATFLIDFLTLIRDADPPLAITRHGMDAALDILFSHPAIHPLLLDDHSTVALQEHYATTYVADTTTSDLFRSYWTHIILPAWNQHRDIQRTVAATGQS